MIGAYRAWNCSHANSRGAALTAGAAGRSRGWLSGDCTCRVIGRPGFYRAAAEYCGIFARLVGARYGEPREHVSLWGHRSALLAGRNCQPDGGGARSGRAGADRAVSHRRADWRRRHGRGYRAQQHEPIDRTVAIKVIKLGMDTRQVIARFDASGRPWRRWIIPTSPPCSTPAPRTAAGLLRDGARRWRADHHIRRSRAATFASVLNFSRSVRGRAARTSESDHPSRSEALEHPRHAKE